MQEIEHLPMSANAEMQAPSPREPSCDQEDSHEGSSFFSHKSQFDEDTVITHIESKIFSGVPREWHETVQVKHLKTQRVKLYFKCKHAGCKSVFKKSCNLRDHFRKHTGQRPFTCAMCLKTFT